MAAPRMWPRRALLQAAGGLALAALGAGATRAEQPPVGTLNYDSIRARGILRIPYYEDFAPYSATTPDGPKGIDIAIGREVAQRIGLQAEFFPLVAGEKIDDDLRNGIWRGNVVDRTVGDLMFHIPYDKQIQINNDLTVLFGPYFEEGFAIATDPERMPGGFDPDQDADKRIGVEVDTMPDFFLASGNGGKLRAATVHFPRPVEAVAALGRGEVDAVIIQAAQLEAFAPALAPKAVVRPFLMGGMFRSRWTVGCAIRETCRPLVYEVGDALAAMQADGTMQRLFTEAGVTYWAPQR
ncbi:substrate-binding periplasmic protein [Zavarzinia compransoris]|uniref:ABC transporter substrate-binding protein n=1 Tax=Zavarzinia compransoris TaxID=1264899 RepID=A0A317DXM8_9PROT|nr:transporter substrate-binding domain-containing protein [Zavarzinia compransoris]PWR18700.1 ABC transporter substrate-binding protein [Zavarzinia compransoris]TDP48679.1 amino acid ABC transporter substrate-binding protein (PAAT family) [Zavarzinia compransoris]